MGKPKAPTPPDPRVTAGAQTGQNIGTAIAQQQLNNVSQVTPFGNLTYEQTGSHQYTDPNSGKTFDVPTYTATQTLSRDQQAIHDQNQRTSLNLSRLGANQSRRLDGLLSRPMRLDVDDAGPIRRTYGTDFSEDRQRTEDALMARMSPKLARDRASLETRLASQGIRIGSDAYSAAMEDFGRQSNDARMSAILGAGQEQSRLAGLEAGRAGFENAARQSALQEAFALRNQPINEITALMSGAQVQSPNFVNANPAQLANTDYAGIVSNNHSQKMANYQAKMGSWNNIWGGLAGLGGSLIMASDRRVKTDVKKLGKTEDGLGIYKYRYKGSDQPQIGLMAQEVEKKKPEAVITLNGLKMVNYDRALGGAT